MKQKYHFDSFPAADKTIWTDTAKKELKGKDPFETLTISKENFLIKPYYDVSDIASLKPESLKPSTDPYLGPRAWHNSPLVKITDSVAANKVALNHLANGADGILFQITGKVEIEKLLAGIELPYCGIYFLIEDEQSTLLVDFEQYVNNKKWDKAQLAGGVFWRKMPPNKIQLVDLFKSWEKFHVLGIMSLNESDSSSQIADQLIQGVNIINDLVKDGAATQNAIAQIAFSITMKNDFFLEIAKLKALRRLWRQVIMVYGLKDEYPTLIHGLSPFWNDSSYEPNANMLKSTTTAMSAILGGCNVITIMPEEDEGSFKSRVARNVLTILREESYLNLTADATVGSYYLENLIEQISISAWKKFQEGIA